MSTITMSPAPPPWIAYYADWSGFVLFATEVEALRYAVDHSMKVAQVAYGQDVREQVNAS